MLMHQSVRVCAITAVMLAMAVPAKAEFRQSRSGSFSLAQSKASQSATSSRLPKSQTQSLWRQALSQYQAGRFQSAITLLEQLVQAHDKNYDLRILLGGSYFQLKQHANAMQHFRQATVLRPGSAGAWSLLGSSHTKLKQYPKARKAFLRALKLQPNYADAHLGIGVVYYNQRQDKPAILHYQRYVQLRPKRSIGHAYLGDAYRRAGRFEAAIAAYTTALKLDPKNPIATIGIDLAQTQQR